MCLAQTRKRDAEQTRARILEAAQHVFSLRPYAEASLKEITARAKANPALVSRYFGSKEKLFEAALDASLDPGPLMPDSRERFGDQVVEAFLGSDRRRANPLSMLIFSTAEASLQAIALRLLRARIVSPLATWLAHEDAETRAARLMVVASGFFIYRSLLPLESMAGDIDPATRRWLAKTFQSAIDDD